MKPTQQEIIELAREAGGYDSPQYPDNLVMDTHDLERFVTLLLERFGAGGGEPVASIYITPSGDREFDDWKHDLSVGRNLLYTHPSPTDLRAEYLRGLEDAAKVADDDDHIVDGRGYYDQLGDAKLTAANIREAIEALKGKQ